MGGGVEIVRRDDAILEDGDGVISHGAILFGVSFF